MTQGDEHRTEAEEQADEAVEDLDAGEAAAKGVAGGAGEVGVASTFQATFDGITKPLLSKPQG